MLPAYRCGQEGGQPRAQRGPQPRLLSQQPARRCGGARQRRGPLFHSGGQPVRRGDKLQRQRGQPRLRPHGDVQRREAQSLALVLRSGLRHGQQPQRQPVVCRRGSGRLRGNRPHRQGRQLRLGLPRGQARRTQGHRARRGHVYRPDLRVRASRRHGGQQPGRLALPGQQRHRRLRVPRRTVRQPVRQVHLRGLRVGQHLVADARRERCGPHGATHRGQWRGRCLCARPFQRRRAHGQHQPGPHPTAHGRHGGHHLSRHAERHQRLRRPERPLAQPRRGALRDEPCLLERLRAQEPVRHPAGRDQQDDLRQGRRVDVSHRHRLDQAF